MRTLLALVFTALMIVTPQVYGAFTQKTVWDVRTTGSDDNAGGFDTSSGGTDRSTQDTAYITINGSTCLASVTSATPSVVTLTGCDYTQAPEDVGNTVNFSGGTATAGRYRIASASIGSWTLDRNACATGTCDATGTMGGALATLGQAVAMFPSAVGGVADMKIALKTGTYTITSALTLAAVTGTNSNTIEGYQTVHGDMPTGSNRPVLQLTTGGGGNGLAITSATGGWRFANIIFDAMGTQTVMVAYAGTATSFHNVTMRNGTTLAVTGTGLLEVSQSEFYGFVGSTNYIFNCGGSKFTYNWFHDNNNQALIQVGGNAIIVVGNLFTNNTGKGLSFGSTGSVIVGNTFYKQTGAALWYYISPIGYLGTVANNLFACGGTYGIDYLVTPAYLTDPGIDYNAYHANASGTIHYVSPGPHDVTIGASGTACATNNPFTAPVNSGAGDWTPNTVAGAGTLVRGMGFAGPLPGLTAVSRPDIGAYQSRGGGGGAFPFVQ